MKQKIAVIILSGLFLAGGVSASSHELTISSSPAGNIETGKSKTLTVSGGVEPYTWSFAPSDSGSLTPTAGKTVKFTAVDQVATVKVTVKDKDNKPGKVEFDIVKGTGTPGEKEKPACPPGQKPKDEKKAPDPKTNPCILTNPAPGQLVGDITTFDQLLTLFIRTLLYFAGAIAVIFLIVGGFRYVTSVGNEEAMEKAKKTITGAVVGIIIIVLAFAIVTIINTILTRGPGEQAQPGTPGGPAQAGDVIITTTAVPEFVVGESKQFVFSATNCDPDCEWVISGIGATGIKQEGKTGVISGRPGISGDFPLTVRATNTKTGKVSQTKSFTLKVVQKEPATKSP